MRVLVTVGYFDDSGEGRLVEVDLASEKARTVMAWTPPGPFRVPARGFAGASWSEDHKHLYVAGHAAVFRVDIARAQVDGILHQPSFNDLHHVACASDRLFVVNTGCSSIDVFALDGEFLATHSLLPTWVNARRIAGGTPPHYAATLHAGWEGSMPEPWPPSPADPYVTPGEPFFRARTKDYHHPNHVFVAPDALLVTCLLDGSVRDMTRGRRVLDREGLHPHDGQVVEGRMWLTDIDGRVIAAGDDAENDVVIDAFGAGLYGWCRGLLVTPETVVVGLSEVRAGRLPRHRWCERDPQGSSTAIVAFDREGRPAARVDLTDQERHAKVYSILELP